MKKLICLALLYSLLSVAVLAAEAPPVSGPAWPNPVPCRVEDGSNPDLFMMSLGDVQTPAAQGTFDPSRDQVTLKDGKVMDHYFRDTRGVKYYTPLDKSIFPLPPSGWCTWYYYYTRINATEVKRNAEWIGANLKDFGCQVVQIDDGWQGGAGNNRDWTTINPQHFPDGMSKVAAHIKSLGLTPGLWLAPHGQSNPQVVSNNPGVFLLKPDGTSASSTWEGTYLVDSSTDATQTYLKNLFTKLSGWGYDYFKIDGQPIVVDEYRLKKEFLRNKSDDAAGLYRNTLGSIRSVIGPKRYLLGCWGTPIEGAGIMNGSRTGGDIVLGWGGFQVALRATLQGFYLHNIVWYSDPDVLIVRSPLTLDQARVWAAIYGLTGQAMLDSDRLMDLSEERVELLRRVYPATNIRPLDLFPTERYKRIWDLKVNHLGRKYDVVGVFNFKEGKSEQTFLKWEDLGLPANQLMHVYDFWNKDYLGSWAGGMMVENAATSCRVLTIVPASEPIQLISTSRHITQGPVDLVSLSQEKSGLVQKGTSTVVRNDPYELRFAFARGTNFAIKSVSARGPSGRLPVKISNHQTWATAEFTSPRNGNVTWEVQFEGADFYHYPTAAPEGVSVERAGLDEVTLRWREQYYLNAGYQVYLNGQLMGYTPSASFPLRNLDPQANYSAQVKSVWEDGRENASGTKTVEFSMASLVPPELSLTEVEPAKSNALWRGFEIDEKLSGAAFDIAGKRFGVGLGAFGNSEIEFDLKGLYQKFTTRVGVDASSSEDRGLEFIVLGDGRELWRSGPVKKADEPKSADVEIKDVKRLILRVVGQAEGRREQGDWISPRVMRTPAAQ